MRKVKTMSEFIAEDKSAERIAPLLEKFSVSIDAENTAEVEKEVEALGGKVTKKLDFGVIEVVGDNNLVKSVKKLKDVTDVSVIKEK